MNHETNEATELAAWLDNHVRHLQTLQVNLDVMPSTEIVLFSRIAELLRQQAPASAPAAEGEAEATAIKLQQLAPQNPLGIADPTITRAAELLRQQGAAPAPADEGEPISLYEPRHSPPSAILAAPSSERPWERDGWCDAEGKCWFGLPADGPCAGFWKFCKPSNLVQYLPWSLPHWAIPSIPTINPTQEGA